MWMIAVATAAVISMVCLPNLEYGNPFLKEEDCKFSPCLHAR